MIINGQNTIVGTLIIEVRDAFSRAYRSISIASGDHLEISDQFRFDPAITSAVTGGFITITLENQDAAAQEDLTGGGGTDPDSVQIQNITSDAFTLHHNNKKILSISTDDTYTAAAIDDGTTFGQRLLIVALETNDIDATIPNSLSNVQLNGDWLRTYTQAWLLLEWDGAVWNELDRDAGRGPNASGEGAVAQNRGAARGDFSHAEGESSTMDSYCHAEGNSSTAYVRASHAEGEDSSSYGRASHAEGNAASGSVPDAFTISASTVTINGNALSGYPGFQRPRYANGDNLFFFGLTGGTNNKLNFSSNFSIASTPVYNGSNTTFDIDGVLDDRTGGQVVNTQLGQAAHAEGNSTGAGSGSHAEGQSSSYGVHSHAEGENSLALTTGSHVEGSGCYAYGDYGHAEGQGCNIGSLAAHAEGQNCNAYAVGSHAEGQGSTAGGSPDIFTVSGGNIVISGDVTNRYRNSDGLTVYFLTGGTNNTLFFTTGTISSPPTFDSVNTTITVGFSLDDRTGGTVQNQDFGSFSHAEGSNTHSQGRGSHSEGSATFSNGDFSHAGGVNSVARQTAQHALASGQFTQVGDAQATAIVSRGSTSDATPTEIFVNGFGSPSERILIATNYSTYGYSIKAIARQLGGTSVCAYFDLRGFITRENGPSQTRLLNGSANVTSDPAASAWTVVPSADTSHGALALTVTGAAGTSVQWVVHVELVETIESK